MAGGPARKLRKREMQSEAGRAEAREPSSTHTEDRQVSENEDSFRGLAANLLRA